MLLRRRRSNYQHPHRLIQDDHHCPQSPHWLPIGYKMDSRDIEKGRHGSSKEEDHCASLLQCFQYCQFYHLQVTLLTFDMHKLFKTNSHQENIKLLSCVQLFVELANTCFCRKKFFLRQRHGKIKIHSPISLFMKSNQRVQTNAFDKQYISHFIPKLRMVCCIKSLHIFIKNRCKRE